MTSKNVEEKAGMLRDIYRKRMYNKEAGKPRVTQILMERTYNSAVLIAAMLHDIEWERLVFDMYYVCSDLPFQRFIRMFDSQLELAKLNEEKFIFGLHKFYERISRELRKEGKFYEFGQFMGAVMQLQYEKRQKVNGNIVDAYLTLLLQILEYLRKDKTNLSIYPYGVSTDGEILEGPYPLADSDLPAMEIEQKAIDLKYRAKQKGEIILSEEMIFLIAKTYRKYGYSVNSKDDLDIFEQTQRTHCNTAAAMFPLINEYTFDMVMLDVFDARHIPFESLEYSGQDIATWKTMLRIRNRTLPSNGVRFELGEDGELHWILMKELLYNGSVHMLYKVAMEGGCLSGYFNTASGFLYNTLRDANTQVPYNKLSALVLSLYASQVLAEVKLEDAASCFTQNGTPLVVSAFGRSGKIQDMYHKRAEGTTHRNLENYDKEERQINVIIRTLPEGHKASEEAKALAEEYGYDLAPNQTFVRPFVKEVFVRKKNP